ncbi:MAG: sigma-70 family RNA polymerase sigma factor [Sedimentisphaerales bacterium]|nr:sigma-70 family RNA polymerase sigma factor [Sedimentisphaerales bacterium]
MPEVRVKNKTVMPDDVARGGEVFSKHGDFIRAVIRYKVKNEVLAEDIFQDFFLSIVSRPIPSGVHNIKGYLYKAIINDIADATRRIEQYKARVNKYIKFSNFSVYKNEMENALIEEEETKKMFKLIEGRVRRSEARAISLRYRDGYKVKEVAKQMQVERRTVSRYITSGLGKIRKYLTVKQGV